MPSLQVLVINKSGPQGAVRGHITSLRFTPVDISDAKSVRRWCRQLRDTVLLCRPLSHYHKTGRCLHYAGLLILTIVVLIVVLLVLLGSCIDDW